MKNRALLLVSLCIASHVCAQNTRKIDQLFEDWNQPQHPGGVVYISRADEIVYAKAFGLANIQYAVPHTTASMFNLASVSKQFTAVGILLLEEEGSLSLEDPIQTYMPELPNFASRISIRHLLHHTSGLRSVPELFGLAGWRDGDAISTEDVLNYTCKQKELNFEPGSEYMYSNTNYVLLATIISRVTQQNFADWMKLKVFDPLGMSTAYIDASNQNLTTHTSTPYMENETHQFQVARNSSLDIGAANMYASAPELMRWLKQLSKPDPSWKKVVERMWTTDTLTNGRPNEYAFGLIHDTYKGHTRIYHPGGVPGFLAYSMHFPDEQLSLVVLMNYMDFKADERIESLLSLFLADKTPRAVEQAPIQTLPLNVPLATQCVADYWNSTAHYTRSVFLENDTLWYLRTNGFKSPLLQIEDSVFVLGNLNTMVRVRFGIQGGQVTMQVQDGDKPAQMFEPFDSAPPTTSDLKAYSGVYFSPELETSYHITADDHGLTGYHSRHGYFPIEVLRKGVVNWSGMAVATYRFDDEGKVKGFYVTMDRVRNVWFERRE